MKTSISNRAFRDQASQQNAHPSIALETRFLGQDIVTAKKIAARILPDTAPAVRVELLARALGYRTAAAFQAGFKAIPAVPNVVATPLDDEGPAAELLSKLSTKDKAAAHNLGDKIISKILQDRFRVAKSAPNKIPTISAAKIESLGPLAAATLAARRIIAEAGLRELALAPLIIEEEDIREAWIAAGATAAPPRAKGVAAALLLAIDLGLDAASVAELDAHQVRDGNIPLGKKVVAEAGNNARGALQEWIGPFEREGAALTPDLLQEKGTQTAIESGARCNPDDLDALVFAATGSKKVGLGPLTLRDAAITSHLILCFGFGKSPKGAARRLGLPSHLFNKALSILGVNKATASRDIGLAKHLGISLQSSKKTAEMIGSFLEEADSALDEFIEVIDRVQENRKREALQPPSAPVVLAIEKTADAKALVEIAKSSNKDSAAHIAAYFKQRNWQPDYFPSLLSRPLNPLNVFSREVIEIAWNEGSASENGAAFALDWTDTFPVNKDRNVLLDGPFRLEVFNDNSACALVNVKEGQSLTSLPKSDDEMIMHGRSEAWHAGLRTQLDVECLPFPLSVRGSVKTASGVRIALGAKIMIAAIKEQPSTVEDCTHFDPEDQNPLQTPSGVAVLRRQLEREIEALQDFSATRSLGLQAETPKTAERNCSQDNHSLPWSEPYILNESTRWSGHNLRLRWRLGGDPAHAHLSRDPYSKEEREWAQEALDLAVGATAKEAGLGRNDLTLALTAPNLATGAPAGVLFLGHPLHSIFAEMHDPDAPDRIESARQAVARRLAAVVAKLTKPGYVYKFGQEVLPLKLAVTKHCDAQGDVRVLDRRLEALLSRYPEQVGPPGAE